MDSIGTAEPAISLYIYKKSHILSPQYSHLNFCTVCCGHTLSMKKEKEREPARTDILFNVTKGERRWGEGGSCFARRIMSFL